MKRIVVVTLGLVGVAGLSAGAAGDRSIQDVAREIARQPATARPDVQALAANEVFNTVLVNNPAGQSVVGMSSDSVGDGVLIVGNRRGFGNGSGRAAILVSASDAGMIAVADASGRDRFYLAGDLGLVAAAADIAEHFTTVTPDLPAGTVMVIDPESRGAVLASSRPYDARVAGVLSGANDYKPGITLGALSGQPNRIPLTLSGTVYCRATNANGAIRAGDLLTTSSLAGHAMKATDPQAAHGAVLGKAMEDLKGGQGLILVLASLQ